MKDLCIVYQKENRSLAKKIVSKLESDGISCNVAPRDYKQEEKESTKKAIEESKVMLLIMDNKSVSSKELMEAMEVATENEKGIIPFVIEKIDSNIYTEYFFFAYSWIDAYDDSFEEAYEVLIDAYEELSGGKPVQKKSKGTKQNKQDTTGSKPILYGIIAVLVLIAVYFIYDSSTETEETEILVGEWHLGDYQDNLKRSSKDSLDFITRVIPTIKRNALLIFNEDHSFERRGFQPQPEFGKWKLNDEGTVLYLESDKGKGHTDQLRIDGLSPNKFTIVVDEILPDSTRSNTRLTFVK